MNNLINDNIFNNKKVIIFDLDGTLIDSVNMFNEIYAVLVKEITGKIVYADQNTRRLGYFRTSKYARRFI